MQHLNIKAITASLFLSSACDGKGLLVIAGGYQSCPRDGELVRLPHPPVISQIIEAAAPLIRAVAAKEQGVTVVWSCFSGVKRGHRPYESISHGPMSFLYGKIHESDREQPFKIDYRSDEIDRARPLAGFFQFMEDQIDDIEPSGIYLAGHSFGGWAVLQTGTRLAQKQIEIEGITLLDPISPFQCPANIMATSLAFHGQTPPGCQDAPSDLSTPDMTALRSHTKWRTNIYQTKFSPLHSSAVNDAGWENELITTFPYFIPFRDFHTYLSTASESWIIAAKKVNSNR